MTTAAAITAALPAPRRPLGWAVIAPALLVPLLGSLLYFVWVPEGLVGRAAYTATKLFTLIYPLVFLRFIDTSALSFGSRAGFPSRRAVVTTGLVSGALIAGLGALLMLSPLGDMVHGGAGAVNARADGLGFRDHFVAYALFVCVVHSGIEELYWRFFVYGNLRALCPRWAAHAIAGVAFAAHHLVVTLQFFDPGLAVFMAASVAIGGVLWSWMYERQGTLLGSWLSHFCVDALLMTVGYQILGG